jgi:hypothetical protein
MGVIWFNDDDSQHSVTFNDTNPEAIDSADIAPGDSLSTSLRRQEPMTTMTVQTPNQRGGST